MRKNLFDNNKQRAEGFRIVGFRQFDGGQRVSCSANRWFFLLFFFFSIVALPNVFAKCSSGFYFR